LSFAAVSVASLSTASGSAPSFSARAWVNFNGTGTVAIRESGNVTSITDNGAGDYTINFTTALSDANYSVGAMVKQANNGMVAQFHNSVSPTTSACRILLSNVTQAFQDSDLVTLNIFR
jgi:hypothetical protein